MAAVRPKTAPAPWLAAVAVLLTATKAPAQPGCPEALGPWLRACEQAESIVVHSASCPHGRTLVSASSGGPALRVELGPAHPGSFRKAGSLGLSPIGDFPDWASQPLSDQRVLDALGACASRDSAWLDAAAAPSPAPPQAGATPVPWRAAGGAAALLALAAIGLVRARRAALRDAAIALSLAALAWVHARALFSPGFFHPNGQGPAWVARAVDPGHGGWDYGPGYGELFAWLAHGRSQPEDALIFVHSLLGAVLVGAVFFVARAAGASRGLAIAAAIVVAADPIRARVFQSPSYYGTCAALLAAASVSLAAATWRGRFTRVAFPVGVLGAALLAAQAARVHPIAWAAVGCVPLCAWLGRGSLRARVRVALAGSLLFLCAFAAATLPSLLQTSSTELWSRWVPRLAAHPWPRPALPYAVAIAALAAAAILGPRRQWLRASAAALGVLAWAGSVLVSGDGAAYEQAYFLLFCPLPLAALAALRWEGRLRRVAPGLLAAAGLLAAVDLFPAVAKPSLPATEAAFAMQWRAHTPAGTEVTWLERAGNMLVMLPLYRGHATARPLAAGDSAWLPRSGYWYRSSLCSTAPGAATCEHIESRLLLEPIATAEFESVPGHPAHSYNAPTTRVGLYRITGTREP
jgi:hypothetical protein